jgi:hypothetical protein
MAEVCATYATSNAILDGTHQLARDHSATAPLTMIEKSLCGADVVETFLLSCDFRFVSDLAYGSWCGSGL